MIGTSNMIGLWSAMYDVTVSSRMSAQACCVSMKVPNLTKDEAETKHCCQRKGGMLCLLKQTGTLAWSTMSHATRSTLTLTRQLLSPAQS